MRNARFLLAFLLVSANALAQQEVAPSSQDGPMALPTGPAAIPQPDENGVYRLGPGIAPPVLVSAEPAAYPQGSLETDTPHMGMYAVVVGADGSAQSVKTIYGNDSVYDAGAIEAIQKSKFTPGKMGDKPVPVLVHVRVPFFHLQEAIPTMLQRYALRAQGSKQAPGRGPSMIANGITPPKPIHMEEAEFSGEARRNRVEGIVIVSLIVSEKGRPTDIKVVRSVGSGLDEKAMQAVSRYRFQPAMKDGKPVAVPISVEVSFRFAR